MVRMFIPDAPGAAAYLDQQLERFPSDWVVLQTTAAGLTIRTVPYRVSNLFGARAGRMAERIVGRVDLMTAPLNRGRTPQRRNRSLRWFARHVIGVDTRTRYRPLVDGYLSTIGRLARLEETSTAVVGTGQPHSAVTQDNPRCVDAVVSFNRELAEAARLRRIPWIEHDPAPQSGGGHDGTFVDGLHKNREWHQQIAADVLAALTQERVAQPPPATRIRASARQ